jgi:pSer/pThr/pTyr-binding forkhead associated (FHA) protein
MEKTLRIINGPDKGTVLKILDWTEIVIGRSSKCDLIVYDEFCSGRHVLLRASVDMVVAKDLNSKNGICVNGDRVTYRELNNGDVFRLGHTEIQFLEAVPISTLRQLDEVADRFEENWRASSNNSLEPYLSQVEPSVRRKLLDHLLDVDVELRLHSGNKVLPKDYVAYGEYAVRRVNRYLQFHSDSSKQKQI